MAALTKLDDGFKSGEIKPATSEILGPPQEAIRAKKRRRAQKAGGAPGALGLGLKTPSFEWVVAPKGVVVS